MAWYTRFTAIPAIEEVECPDWYLGLHLRVYHAEIRVAQLLMNIFLSNGKVKWIQRVIRDKAIRSRIRRRARHGHHRPHPSAGYPYRTMQAQCQIRILEIFPGANHDESLRGRFVTCELDEAPSFEAVSYHWDSHLAECSIQVDGSDLAITTTVSSLLRRYRHQTDMRHLWIDAICIDQNCNVEKDAQIGRMADIYKRAERTLVWLGEEDELTSQAFDMVECAHGCIEKARNCFAGVPSLLQLRECGFPPGEDHRWYALNRLLSKPWFTRTWILQEVALARDVVVTCGRLQCAWQRLATLAIHMCGTDANIAVGIPSLARAATIEHVAQISKHEIQPPLYILLVATSPLQATHTRDKFFAIHGLATDKSAFAHLIDSGKTTSQVYVGICSTYIDLGIFAFLHAAGDSSWHREQTLPSWVPDWSADRRPFSFGHLGHRRFLIWHCTRPYVLENRILRTAGVIKDKVRYIGNSYNYMRPKHDSMVFFFALEHWRYLSQITAHTYPTGETMFDAFVRVLTADRFKFPSKHFATPTELYKAYRTQFRTHDLSTKSHRNIMEAELFDFHSVMQRACASHGFFITAKGLIGLGSFFTRPGDLVVELHGGLTPFIIRRTHNQKYELIGEAYVHGLVEVGHVSPDDIRQIDLV